MLRLAAHARYFLAYRHRDSLTRKKTRVPIAGDGKINDKACKKFVSAQDYQRGDK